MLYIREFGNGKKLMIFNIKDKKKKNIIKILFSKQMEKHFFSVIFRIKS